MEPGDFEPNLKKLKFESAEHERNKNNKVDRISDLPEAVLHHILSSLDMKIVVQTSVLSKRWRYVWKSVPILNFSSKQYYFMTGTFNGFQDFVDKVMHLRDNSDIQKFKLLYPNSSDTLNYLNSWILAALNCNLQELYLNFAVLLQYRVPFYDCLFNSKSLRLLDLRYYCGHSNLWLPDSMSLPRLQTLRLDGITLGQHTGDDISNKIFSSCPVLESLSLRRCGFKPRKLNIASLKLKHLVIEDCYTTLRAYNYRYKLQLFAPNLVSFQCGRSMSTEYSIEDVSALVKAEIGVEMEKYKFSSLSKTAIVRYAQRMTKLLTALHNVRTLTLSGSFLQVVSGDVSLFDSTSIRFSNLRCLKMETFLTGECIPAITYILNISPNVESLFLKLKEVKFDVAKLEDDEKAKMTLHGKLHHLKFVEIRGVHGSVIEFMFLEFLLKNAVVLEKMVLFSTKRLVKFTKELLTLPKASSSSEIIVF